MGHAFQTPGVYIGDKDFGTAIANVTGPTRRMWSDGVNGWTFHNAWSGTPTATLKFYASNDMRLLADPESSAANWVEITSTVTHVNPAGSATQDMVIVSNSRFGFIRMDVTGESGSGNFNSWDGSHGAG